MNPDDELIAAEEMAGYLEQMATVLGTVDEIAELERAPAGTCEECGEEIVVGRYVVGAFTLCQRCALRRIRARAKAEEPVTLLGETDEQWFRRRKAKRCDDCKGIWWPLDGEGECPYCQATGEAEQTASTA